MPTRTDPPARAACLAAAASTIAACGARPAGETGLVALFGAVVSIAATLALLHALLFVFESRDRRNLFLALLASAFALVTFLDYRERVGAEVVLAGLGPLQRWAVSALILAVSRFAFSLFSPRAPQRLWIYAAAITGLLLVAVPRPDLFPIPAGLLGLIVTLDALGTLVAGWRRLESGAWIVGLGAGIFAVGGLLQLGFDLAGAGQRADAFSPYLWGGLALLLASSIYLARTFARNRRELESRLAEVEELSARALAQEKAAREEEVRRRLLEAQNARRGRELEEARSLQLALLPQTLPRLPGVELAATMMTATEVGGDFYDAVTDSAGTLWLAVGDAAGHGARAGALAAVAKGLHAGIAAQPSPAAALARFDEAMRGMGLKRAHLALMVGRLSDGVLELAAAGMPPALVRRASGAVEEVVFSSLPLGAPLAQDYPSRRLELAPGDLALLMTDGLVELPGDDGSPLGYAAVREVVAAEAPAATEPLGDWVDRLLLRLRGGAELIDDITIVALARR